MFILLTIAKKRKRRSIIRRRGLYPALILLGIHDQCSPDLNKEISMIAARQSSFKEAATVFAGRGLELDKDTICLISYRYSARARAYQQSGVAFTGNANLAGRPIVLSTDGGRVRVRVKKKGLFRNLRKT